MSPSDKVSFALIALGLLLTASLMRTCFSTECARFEGQMGVIDCRPLPAKGKP